MKTQRSNQNIPISEDDALEELSAVLPATDRVRFAALGHVASFATAKQKSRLRQEKALVSRYGSDSAKARNARQQLEGEKRFGVSARVETQRVQAEEVSRNPQALTLRGRVTNPQRLAIAGLTVSATDEDGHAVTYTRSNDNGHFVMAVPADENTADQNVRLLVSDKNKAVLYRGSECFAREPEKIFYRELTIGTAAPEEEPTPPPDIDPKSVTVPDVQGFEENTARTQIRAAGLSVESTIKEGSNENVGRVIDQKPPGGTNVAPCSLVNIVIGAQSTVEVPNVVGKTLREAQATLKKADLAMGKITPDGASLQSIVVEQSPAAESQVPPQTAVDLNTEEPVQQSTVPNVVKLKLPSAKNTIIKAGFTLGEIEPLNASDQSVVTDQTPAGGTKADAGSPVDLVARELAAKSVVPNVVQLTLSDARTALEKEKLKLGTITPTDAPARSVVLKQKPRAGTEVDERTPVDLEVKTSPKAGPKAKKKPVAPGVSRKSKPKTRSSKKVKSTRAGSRSA